MAVIDRFRNITTVFEVFEMPKSEEAEFIQQFSDFIQIEVKPRAGFVSYNLHISAEGELFNYAQWKSMEDYESFLNDESLRERRESFYSKLNRSKATKVVFTS